MIKDVLTMSKEFNKIHSSKSLHYFTQISGLYQELDFLQKLILEKNILIKELLSNILSEKITVDFDFVGFNEKCKQFIKLFEEKYVLENIHKDKSMHIEKMKKRENLNITDYTSIESSSSINNENSFTSLVFLLNEVVEKMGKI
jgi:hypothetical protein